MWESRVLGQQHTNNQAGGGGQQQQQNQTNGNANNTVNANGGNNNGTKTNTGNVTTSNSGNNRTNVTSNAPSSTPITFPLAPLPSSGALAGTYQAPFPAGGGGGSGQALGPDDTYIAAAMRLLPIDSLSVKIYITFVLLILAGATLL